MRIQEFLTVPLRHRLWEADWQTQWVAIVGLVVLNAIVLSVRVGNSSMCLVHSMLYFRPTQGLYMKLWNWEWAGMALVAAKTPNNFIAGQIEEEFDSLTWNWDPSIASSDCSIALPSWRDELLCHPANQTSWKTWTCRCCANKDNSIVCQQASKQCAMKPTTTILYASRQDSKLWPETALHICKTPNALWACAMRLTATALYAGKRQNKQAFCRK